MGTKSPGPQRCRLILNHCLAIQLNKPGHTPEDFWMYDSGYMIFQNFLAANAQCWWNAPLTAATRALKYAGHVAPGMLLVTAEPCALEVLRGAYARSVLKPPATYVISSVGDIDDCIVTPTTQGQFTPLPEALCDVIMDLTSQGQSATIENIRMKLSFKFPHMQPPTTEMIYDSLAQLMQERKIYQTAKGYFIVTPERRRSRSRPKHNRSFEEHYDDMEPSESRIMLMTNSEAVHSLYGEISTERDGDLTHQCIQTNLADVICGGNPNDKILYARSSKRRSASFPTPRSLERRHSLRLFGSSKRLQRCASTRSLSKNYAQTLTTDSSSSEYQSTDSSSPKKASLLSRLFRRSGRSKQRQIETFSAQFPPAEWFNSKAVHLHSIGTQTTDHDIPDAHTLSNSTFYDGSELSQRSSTLPRRHHRRHLSSESTFVISSRDCSPIRRGSPVYCSSSLLRSTHSIPVTNNNGLQSKTQRTIPSKHLNDEQNRMAAKSGEIYGNKSIDNKSVNNDRHYNRSIINSGPSSFDSSGRASSAMNTSGPSSIDSIGKNSYSRNSGHSSLESQSSTLTQLQSANSRSVFLNGSPKCSPKHHNNILGKSKLASDTHNGRVNNNSSPSHNCSPSKRKVVDENFHPTVLGKPPSRSSVSGGVPNSNSNSSITLQVTTSNESNIPSTKIYVQNSPVRSVITLENGKLTDKSNVFIINNETTTNGNGELIKRTISKQGQFNGTSSPTKLYVSPKKMDKQQQDQLLSSETNSEAAYETGDSLSLISETSPESSLVIPINNDDDSTSTTPELPSSSTTDILENSKFTKNINNDATMNNSRKLSLQISNPSNNIVYKNVLKDVFPTNTCDSNPTSPLKSKNCFELEQNRPECSAYERIAGSVGNLRYFEKNGKKLNSNCDLKNLQFESPAMVSKLNSNPAINTDSLAHILHKNIITVGSEPNLAMKMNELCNQNKDKNAVKSIEKEPVMLTCGQDRRRYSISKDNGEEIYNFPSLTDLSFNFTSLAAQKILQGVSINSIDTLVELNMAQEKQQNNSINGSSVTVAKQATSPPAICTDYGMV